MRVLENRISPSGRPSPARHGRWVGAFAAAWPRLIAGLAVLLTALAGASGHLAFAGEPAAGDVFSDCADCPEMVSLAAGRFVMGSPDDEKARKGTEGPQHEVVVEPFAIGRYEVTVAEFRSFIDDTGYGIKAECGQGRKWDEPRFEQADDQPVVCVDWHAAVAYTKWLSDRTGQSYRLPSEAEWEYAARAGAPTRYWWGDHIGSANAQCNNCGSLLDGERTMPVGSFAPNGFGLYDVLGNAEEWVFDCWNADYDDAPATAAPWLDGNCRERVVRGGDFGTDMDDLRLARRNAHNAKNQYDTIGFRVARD